jgi:hypothetical protein
MDTKVLEKISKNIHKRFPEVSGVKPKVKKQPIPGSEKSNRKDNQNYLLTFNKNVKGIRGQNIPRWVRVVVTPKGKILKITTSK